MSIIKNKYMKKNEPTQLINIRCTESELIKMRENALKYTNGNLSAWIRYSSIELKAMKKHTEA